MVKSGISCFDDETISRLWIEFTGHRLADLLIELLGLQLIESAHDL